MKEIDPNALTLKAVDIWANQWFLLTSGTAEDFNMMTVAWGSIGCMWRRPFVQIVVRPQRYTFEFLEKSDSFTLCTFPPEQKKALQILGSLSGRDGDKLSKTSLTVRPSTKVEAPAYNEASLILECKKMYAQDMDPKGFLQPGIDELYTANDYHRIYFGEIVAAFEKE